MFRERDVKRGPAFGARLGLAVVMAVAALAAAPAAVKAAAIEWTAFAGRYAETKNILLGIGARFAIGRLTANPNVEYVFVDQGSGYAINADLTRTILPLGPVSGWIGAGVGWYTNNPDAGESSTQTGVNLLAGGGLMATRYQPYIQFKWVAIEGDDPTALSVGFRF